MSQYVSIIKQRFGNLTVISLHHTKTYNCGQSVEFYLCKCDCGNETIVSKKNLTSGHTNSCGCLKHIDYNYSHKMKNTRIYKIWCGIKVRCYNQNCKNYQNYGGRGITVCQEWKDNFKSFYDWAIANGYTDTLSIDRIDVNGNYEPKNCRWVNRTIQARNTTRNRLITYNGETRCLSEWAEIYKINYKSLFKKLKRGLAFTEAIK